MKDRAMSVFRLTACALLLAMTSVAQAEAPVAQREILMGTLWMQQSAEFRYSTEQVYQSAIEHLRRALLPGTAALEQEKSSHYAKLPPAIVLDIDETVLDNSAFEGWALKNGVTYSEPAFREWVRLHSAKEIPGAAAFTRIAAKRGIKIFYVTNRTCDKPAEGKEICAEKAATMANMKALNFARADDPAAFLFLGDQQGWGSDKTTRRAYLAQKYRIVMLLGDDLKDILPGDAVNALRRDADPAAYKQYLKRFGHRWFILPNPVYGSWERALPATVEQRYDALQAAPLTAK
jgi:acid phosphatase